MSITFDKSRNKYMVRKGRKGFYGRYDTKNNLKSEKGKSSVNWKGGKPQCLDCHKQVSNYDNKRCWPCSNTAKSGENYPSWKGGVTNESRLQRVKFRKSIQQLVFQRDDYTCQVCDQQGGQLQVDHIKKWSDYPELRFELGNCRTLCMACHYYVTFKRKIPKGIVWGHNLSRRIES